MPLDGRKPSRKEMFLQYLIVFAICVVFPGLTTAFSPASWVRFWREGDVVHCKTWTCVFFVVPCRVQSMEGVKSFEFREIAGRTERVREYGRTTNQNKHVDGKGFLQVRGEGEHLLEVSVSPASRESVLAKANRFLSEPQTESMTMFVIANWKFGAIMGGVLSSLTLLCVVSYTLAIFKFVFGFIWKPRR